MSIHWLHLSDIHFHRKDAWRDGRVRNELLTYLREMFDSGEIARPDLVFCTGDIAFGETGAEGLSEQYDSAKDFFTRLLAVCGSKDAPLPVTRLFVVPGNQDVNRNVVDEDAQAALVLLAKDSRSNMARINARLETKATPFLNAMKRLAAYETFVKEFLPHQVDKEGRCHYAQVVEVNDIRVGIAGFNSAWSCAGPEDDRNLWLGAEWQFNRAQLGLEQAQIRIGLMHHPVDWLNEAEREVVTRRIASGFDFWLHGHVHNAWVEALGNHVRIGAGAVGAGTADEFGMNLVKLDLAGKSEVHLHQFRDGWTIQPVPVQAPRGIWAFGLPARMQALVDVGRAVPAPEAVRTPETAPAGETEPATSGQFQLTALQLKNFRGFADLNLTLHERLTVLVAQNGAGKSTIIDACCLALRPFVSRFDLSGEAEAVLALDDIRMKALPGVGVVRKLPCTITATGQVAKMADLSWQLMRLDERPDMKSDNSAQFINRTKVEADKLQEWAGELQTLVRDSPGLATNLPVFACYGAARMNARATFTAAVVGSDDQYNRTFGYRDCLKPDTDFQNFADWFAWLCQWRDQELVRQIKFSAAGNARTRWDAMLKVVQQALDQLLRPVTGWHTLDFSVEHERSLVLQHDQYGIMKVAQLSDGIRGMLTLVGDLAWRCIKLNPHLGEEAARESTGVVLIDEVEMHLHPAWQQRIIDRLQTAFPKLQFILSTHSPQVLSCVPKECIRIIHLSPADELASDAQDSLVEEPHWQTRGVASGDILSHIMGMGSVPDVAEAGLLSDYRALIQQGLHESEVAQSMRTLLEQHFGAQHEEMMECERLISLEAFKRRMAARKAGGA
jgi:predicted ATP-binding protein involved in virulence